MPAPVITSPATAAAKLGDGFTYQITATNSPAGYSAVGGTDGGLDVPGLTFNGATGLISGTPTAPGSYTVALGAATASGTGNLALALTVSGVQLPASIIPVACDVTNANSFNNATNNTALVIPRASSVQIPCALFIGAPSAATLVTDLTNIVTANLVIRQGSVSGTVLVEYALPASVLNSTLTYAQWTGGSAAHFTFSLTPTDTNQAAGSIFIGIGVTTTNAGDVSCGFSSTGKIVDYGIFNPGAPAAANFTSYSQTQSDARYDLLGASPWAPGINAVGTGAAGSLEAVATLNLPVPTLRTFYNVAEDALENWLLVTSTANTATGVQQPLDYNASSNTKVWFRK
jgi:hypothetical protein